MHPSSLWLTHSPQNRVLTHRFRILDDSLSSSESQYLAGQADQLLPSIQLFLRFLFHDIGLLNIPGKHRLHQIGDSKLHVLIQIRMLGAHLRHSFLNATNPPFISFNECIEWFRHILHGGILLSCHHWMILRLLQIPTALLIVWRTSSRTRCIIIVYDGLEIVACCCVVMQLLNFIINFLKLVIVESHVELMVWFFCNGHLLVEVFLLDLMCLEAFILSLIVNSALIILTILLL